MCEGGLTDLLGVGMGSIKNSKKYWTLVFDQTFQTPPPAQILVQNQILYTP